jgi:hypothetical protein
MRRVIVACTLIVVCTPFLFARFEDTIADDAVRFEARAEKGVLPPGKPLDTAFEVKSYSVQANFDLSTTRIPTSYTILFSSTSDPTTGVFWMNRTPEAVEAATQLIDKAFAQKKAVYYDPSIDALGVGIKPDKSMIGPKSVVPAS